MFSDAGYIRHRYVYLVMDHDMVSFGGIAPCGLQGCKNGPAAFPGRMSYKATKPGLVCLSNLSLLYYCIVAY